MTTFILKHSKKIVIVMALSLTAIASYRAFGSGMFKKSSIVPKSIPHNSRLYSTATSSTTSVSTSKTIPSVAHPSYVEVEKSFIEEYGITAILYKHKKSGAEVMSVTADDNNKVFGVTFRTPPSGMLKS